jgi:hypothetical protein
LTTVTDEFIGSTSLNDVIFKGIQKLRVLFNTIKICNLCLDPNKDDSSSRSIVDSRDIRLNNVTSNSFIATIYIESWIWGLEGFLERGTSW